MSNDYLTHNPDEYGTLREEKRRNKKKGRRDDRNAFEKRIKVPHAGKPRCKTINVSLQDWRGDYEEE